MCPVQEIVGPLSSAAVNRRSTPSDTHRRTRAPIDIATRHFAPPLPQALAAAFKSALKHPNCPFAVNPLL
ncbi:hypothetical protein M0R45_019382 [Rubus argutus]|uniref:Uncharacterized protein n=1 Tax=Rubus argutus TaxID=59490 RepID=A0AAW1X6K8_RUBAR